MADPTQIIPDHKLAYLQEKARNDWYHHVLTKFLEAERGRGLTRAELARRIHSSPAVISRLLGAPGNWTLDTITNLLAGISSEMAVPSSAPLLGRPARNFHGPDWLDSADAPPVDDQPPAFAGTVTASDSAAGTVCAIEKVSP